MPSIEYNDIITMIPKQLSEKRICYVTLNKTFNSLKDLFRKEDINLKNIIFIDAITTSLSKAENIDECYFVSSPQALTELSIVITEFMQYKFDYIIFDSLSTLLIYQKSEEPAIKFISNIVNKIKASGCKGIFYALDIKKHKSMIEESFMAMDKILYLGMTEFTKDPRA